VTGLDFIRNSLRRKVTALAIATTFAALLVSGAALFYYDVRDYRATRLQDLRTKADIIGLASAAAIMFNDPKDAQANLDTLKALRAVDAAALYRADGTLFALYREPQFTLPARAGPVGYTIDNGRIRYFHPIVERGETVGTVYLDAYDGLRDRMRNFLGILGAVMAAALGAAFLLSAWLQRAVTKPILDVADAARSVLERGEFSVRARKSTHDEIGALADAFNRMLEEIEQRTRALGVAVDALQVADRRKDEFLATLAHELRNPLAPLLSSVSILQRSGSADPQVVWARDVIERQVRHMARLLDDLLDVGRVTSNKLELRRQRVSFASIMESAIETSRPLIEQARHRFQMRIPEGDVFLDGDPVRLAQVFSNLLNNAARYTDPGGEISLAADFKDRVLTVLVKDNGIGIAPADLPHVFEIFSQSEPALLRKQGGLGIGLFLVKNLVEMHGGSVAVASAGTGKGTAFTVSLPASASRQTGPAPEHRAAHHDGRALRIVVADDNADAAESLAALLRAVGHEVRVAYDGQQAVAATESFQPSVALLDIGMPRMNGYDAARRIRELPGGKKMLLVAITGWGQQDDRRRAFEAGFDSHLTKPAQLEDLELLIARVSG
jgi:signal transduction histidine kinase